MSRDFKVRGYVVGQSPNPPLWVAFGALVVALAAGSGAIHDLASASFYVALTVWSYDEAARGVNGFRRALGTAVLVLVVIAVARALA